MVCQLLFREHKRLWSCTRIEITMVDDTYDTSTANPRNKSERVFFAVCVECAQLLCDAISLSQFILCCLPSNTYTLKSLNSAIDVHNSLYSFTHINSLEDRIHYSRWKQWRNKNTMQRWEQGKLYNAKVYSYTVVSYWIRRIESQKKLLKMKLYVGWVCVEDSHVFILPNNAQTLKVSIHND